MDNLTVGNYTYGMQSFQPVPEGTDVPGRNRSGSVIGAWKPVEFIDLMAGYSKRQSGNYAAGSSGYELGEDYETNGGYYWDGTPARFSYFQPGQEVYGTYNDTESWLAKAGFHFGEQRVEARYNRTESAYVQHRNPSSQIPDVKGNYQSIYQPASHSRQDRYGLEYTWKPANPLFDLKTEVWAVDTVENNWTNGSGSSAMPTDAAAHIKTDAIGAGISNASMFLLGDMDLTLKFGGNYKREEIESNTSVNGMRTTEWGMFGHAEIEATDWLMLDGGLRHNDYKASLDGNSDFEKGASDLSWQTGITMSPAEWLQVFMRRSKGWRAPSARENSSGSCGQWLTRQGIFGDTQWYCAGPGVLRPELSRNTELGVNVLHRSLLRAEDRFGMKLVYFDNDIGDYIHGIPATTLTGFGGIAPLHNIGNAKMRGYEASMDYDTGVVFATYAYARHLETTYCGVRGKPFCEKESNGWGDLYSQFSPAKHQHNLTLGVRLLDRKLTIGTNATVVRGTNWDYDGLRGYEVYDLFANYQWKDFDFGLSARNVADRYYFEAGSSASWPLPAPGRMVRATVTWHY